MHEEWTDEALYKGLVAREARALEALIRRYSRELSYFIRIVLEGVGTLQDAEECANDLFIAAWREIDSYDPARASLRTSSASAAPAGKRSDRISRTEATASSSLPSLM